jgi:tRNA-dihydrouridine synthase B
MKIGSVELKNNVFLAPMAGVTDLSFRVICKEMGVGLLFTEMVSIKGLYYGDEKTREIMRIEDEEKPTVLQIFGSDPEIFKHVIDEKLNSNQDFEILDINMGCPAPKIVKNGDGSALMKDPERVREIVKTAVRSSNKPVTIKIRKGWDDDQVNAVEIAKIIESEGAAAVTVHGRTREEFYSGTADWDIIRRVKESVSIPVIGNGDIFKPEDIKSMIDYTGCDGVMIGRGARGNPWIFKMGNSLIEKGHYEEPSADEKIDMSMRHLDILIKNKGERIATREIRKHVAWYIKGLRGSAEIKDKVNKARSKEEIHEILGNYRDAVNLTI